MPPAKKEAREKQRLGKEDGREEVEGGGRSGDLEAFGSHEQGAAFWTTASKGACGIQTPGHCPCMFFRRNLRTENQSNLGSWCRSLNF